MPQLTPDLANKIAKARTDVEDIHPVQKAFMLKFSGANSRWMGIAREERADWVTVYINRQSRALDWFPVSDPRRYFDGVDVGFRYVKGHRGKGKNPGMARSIADLRTLKPAEDHVLLLHCSNQAGFEDLVKWYAGERVLGVGQPPAPTEISGEGAYTALGKDAGTTHSELPEPMADLVNSAIDAPKEEDVGSVDAPPPDEGLANAGGAVLDDDSIADSEDDTGRARMADPVRRKAVEMHAVGMAVARYTSLGFEVQERGKPFDLLCTPTMRSAPGTRTVHVEVKGSLGSAAIVHLTRNEVVDARGDGSWRSDLFIVGGIGLSQDEMGVWLAEGGTARWIEDWCPLDDDLMPTDYAYVVPN